MRVQNVHRITGVHQLLHGTGAAIWVTDATHSELERCKAFVVDGLNRLGWSSTLRTYRRYDETVLVIDAPTDQLYTACELLEWATLIDPTDKAFGEVEKEHLREQVPHWQHVRIWAKANGLPVFDCEDFLTLGMGKWSHTFPVRSIPPVETLENLDIRTIPAVYITGTNGKTTTSRMLAEIARVAGFSDGLTSSDGVMVRGKWHEKGDWTGPGAARMVLRHPDVELAVLETARGGLMRRGLVLDGVDVAAVTNVSEDHLGGWGIRTVEDMAAAKLTVGLGVKPGGALVLNAGCEYLMHAYNHIQFRLNQVRQVLFSSKHSHGMTAWLADDQLWLRENGIARAVVDVNAVPLLMGGAAMHNVENALAAMCIAHQLGISVEDTSLGLCRMQPDAQSSRGRCNIFNIRGATVLVDFAHNPAGLQRIFDLVRHFAAKRKFLMFGQASDRSIKMITELAENAAQLKADRYYLKEMPTYSYDVSSIWVPNILQKTLISSGIPEENIVTGGQELEIAKSSLEILVEGDLLVLLSHEQIDDVVAYLDAEQARSR